MEEFKEEVHYYYCRAKLEVDHIKVRYYKHRYSNKGDPGVIYAKLKQPLLTLRTFKKEDYEIKPPSLPPRCDKAVVKLSTVDESSKLYAEHRQAVMAYENTKVPFLKTERQDEVKIKIESEEINAELNESLCQCSCHSKTSQDLPVFEEIKDPSEPRFGWLRRFGGFKAPAEITLDLDDTSDLKQPYKDKEDILMVNNESESIIKPQQARHHLLRRYSLAEEKSESFNSKANSRYHRIIQENERETWKTVFNDISLAAARTSTGEVPLSHDKFTNLKPDFINTKFNTSLQASEEDYCYDVISMYEFETQRL